jgi:hypothetical protein
MEISMAKVKPAKVAPKEIPDVDTLYIRKVKAESKKKFYDKAKALGYKPNELFDQITKGL